MPTHAHRRAGEPGPVPERNHGALLDEIEYRFRLAHAGPSPLSVDGRALGHGLPHRAIALSELSAILMHPSCGFAARDAAWRLLVAAARTGGEKWVVGAVGVALPGLRRKAYLLSLISTGDVQAALVTEFVKALRTVEIDRPGVVSKLLSVAFSAARAALREAEPAACGQATFAPASVLPPAPFGHPDFVLARAVRAGVITAEEADLIGATRLEQVSIAQYAERAGLSRWTAYKRRSGAEQRLVAAIASGALRDPYTDLVAEATLTVVPEPSHLRHRP
jgi:hypothetical protein